MRFRIGYLVFLDRAILLLLVKSPPRRTNPCPDHISIHLRSFHQHILLVHSRDLRIIVLLLQTHTLHFLQAPDRSRPETDSPVFTLSSLHNTLHVSVSPSEDVSLQPPAPASHTPTTAAATTPSTSSRPRVEMVGTPSPRGEESMGDVADSTVCCAMRRRRGRAARSVAPVAARVARVEGSVASCPSVRVGGVWGVSLHTDLLRL